MRFHRIALALLAPVLLLGQTHDEPGIPVTDALVIAKCASCHARDERGNMDRISWERTTPEGWQEAIKKMVLEKHVTLTPEEARSIVKYLSSSHGLAPEEARPVMYYPERRIHDETGISGDDALGACTKCHPAARPLLWRRSREDWKQLAETHFNQYKVQRSQAAIAYLNAAAPLDSTEWNRWSASQGSANLTGVWLVTAHLPGRGAYWGEMRVTPGSAPGEFTTRVTLESARDGSTLTRTGQTLVFGGYAWRGRSRGAVARGTPDDPANEAREALWFSPDGSKAEGRWFWGQYQEFGFDVQLQRASAGPVLLALDRVSLKVGTEAGVIKLLGINFPAQVSASDLNFGPGVSVRRIVSHDSRRIAAEVDVAMNAAVGTRNVSVASSALKDALAIFDRVDYIKVTPESSMAGFGNATFARGYQQFEAIGYQRGPDGKAHTVDDLELGPVDANWSMQVFYAVDSKGNDRIGAVSPSGLLSPAAESPGVNSDIWVVATAVNDAGANGRPLVGKGYVVVAIPEYTFNGRRYVRDLDRWIEEGTW